ncbi:MAG: phosphoribosylglycinamide formyltransferase [Chlorobiaceae bacterium]|nr:phosphoribosylglycinamide formyltransferase [Chlorobiaceae bacterium]
MADNITRLAVFCSGTGSNFRALHEAIHERELPAEIVLCVSNRPQCGAFEFAEEKGVETLHLSERQFGSFEEFEEAMLRALKARGIGLVLLAGYMRKVPDAVVAAYADRILNVHPALLPKFGGEGMYGIRVHTAVIAAGESESGATVHLVNKEYDKGRILLQRTVPVLPGDTPESLADRVLACEHLLYPDALEQLLAGEP